MNWGAMVRARPRKGGEVTKRDGFRWPVSGVIDVINPILRGWVNYFAVGDSSRCFSFIRNWGDQKVRRHLARARQRQGFGWKRWSRRWLYDTPEPKTITHMDGGQVNTRWRRILEDVIATICDWLTNKGALNP